MVLKQKRTQMQEMALKQKGCKCWNLKFINDKDVQAG